VIPGDLGAALSAAVTELAADGDLPPSAAGSPAAGTWRPAQDGDPAGYASTLPIVISRSTGQHPAAIAELLAARLRTLDWIAAAVPARAGFLTITVTAAALAAVAARTVAAGPSCARSDVLAGTTVQAGALPALDGEAGWHAAWAAQRASLTGRLAVAAGATAQGGPGPSGSGVSPGDAVSAQGSTEHSGGERRAAQPMSPGIGAGDLPGAVAYSGEDAVRYLLARTTPAGRAALGAAPHVSYLVTDHYYGVMLAHADAAATGRWADGLGLTGAGRPDRMTALLDRPQERVLLGLLSWLQERVSSAGRGGRPHELPKYLEQVAAAWLDCRQGCPALPFGGRAAPRELDGIAARLLLAEAVRAVLAAGAGLIGITAWPRT
jgi:arginyl-tRNA synthetase